MRRDSVTRSSTAARGLVFAGAGVAWSRLDGTETSGKLLGVVTSIGAAVAGAGSTTPGDDFVSGRAASAVGSTVSAGGGAVSGAVSCAAVLADRTRANWNPRTVQSASADTYANRARCR